MSGGQKREVQGAGRLCQAGIVERSAGREVYVDSNLYTVVDTPAEAA